MTAIEALHLIDRIIGNELTISAEALGQVRGIVLDTLNEYHRARVGRTVNPEISSDYFDDLSSRYFAESDYELGRFYQGIAEGFRMAEAKRAHYNDHEPLT